MGSKSDIGKGNLYTQTQQANDQSQLNEQDERKCKTSMRNQIFKHYICTLHQNLP